MELNPLSLTPERAKQFDAPTFDPHIRFNSGLPGDRVRPSTCSSTPMRCVFEADLFHRQALSFQAQSHILYGILRRPEVPKLVSTCFEDAFTPR